MLSEEIKDTYHRFKEPVKMAYGEKERENFEKSKWCLLCEREFSPADLEKDGLWSKVRDHCHYTERFRGSAHNTCDLKCRKPGFLPVIFHNLSGYDSHLFVKNLGVKEGNVDCIPKNEEIYISFSKEVVVDSYLEKAEGEENANENVKCFLLNVNAKCFLFLLFQLTEAKLFVSGAD